MSGGDGQGEPDSGGSVVRVRPHYGWMHWLVLAVLLAAFGWFYVWTAEQLVTQTNANPEAYGQLGSMESALEAGEVRAEAGEAEGLLEMVQAWVPHRTDGAENPLWPWVVSWVAPEGLDPGGLDSEAGLEFFRLGKWLNVALTGALLLALGMVWGRTYTLLGTINLVLLAGLGGLLPLAVRFGPDALFAALLLLAWVCCVAILKKNSLWLYAALGLVLGLAYLARSSVLPLAAVFLLVTTYRFFSALFPWLLGGGGKERGRACEWSPANHFVGLVFLVFGFVVTAGPRLSYANERFGDPVHDTANYTRWLNDRDAAAEWVVEHRTKEALEAMGEDGGPSMKRYLAEHTGAQIKARVVEGTQTVVDEFLGLPPWAGGRVDEAEERRAAVAEVQVEGGGIARPWETVLRWKGLYLGALAAVMLVVVLLFPLHRKGAVFPSQRIEVGALPIALFTVFGVVVYAVCYGWYRPVGGGEEALLALWAPLVFGLVAGSESILLRVRRREEHPWMLKVYALLQFVVTAGILWRVVEIARNPTFVG